MSDLYDILLIEDSPTQALRFQLLLQRAGYRVHIIADGAEGWRVACDDLPRLILLDVDLPTMDGFQVLARLKRGRATAKISIIMLTNREHVSNVIQALEMGADNYLPKPDALEQLQSAVEELLTC
jgi:DNA-binding response OmpR family regulator